MEKYKLVIIGSGSLATTIGHAVVKNLSDRYEILGIYGRTIKNTNKLSSKLFCKTYETLDEIINDKPDYIIEAASVDLVKNIGIKLIENSISLIPLSVGAFADEEFYKEMEKKAKKNNVRIHIPAGAVGGFDVLRASMLIEDRDVSIITEKSPESLNGAPFLKGRILSEEKSEEVFRGSASEAIKYFPENINVAVATALASRGVNDTEVVIKSIPGALSNKHTIKSTGETVGINIEIESKPSEDNPKSSSLAAYSVVALLENLVSPITF